MKFKKFLLVLLSLFIITPSCLANIYEKWYDEVWTIVNNEFYDKTYNGQDWNIWRNRYDKKLKTESDAIIAINTMIRSLDDNYSHFIPPVENKAAMDNLAGKAYGLGLVIQQANNNLLITYLEENSPAIKSGLKCGDIIEAINNTSIKGLPFEESAKLLNGKVGDKFVLKINRKNEEKKDYTLTYEEYEIDSIDLEPEKSNVKIPNDIIYARIDSFGNRRVAHQLYKEIKGKQNLKGLILDLRDNGGGLVDRAATIGNMFIQNANIVTIVDRDGKEDVIKANEHLLSNVPIVVLINENSASASEILAAAFKDTKRAILVGKKTFGKGIVQDVKKLSEGAGFIVTTKKYLTPNGDNIHKIGVKPDIEVEYPYYMYQLGYDPQLSKAISILKKHK